MADAPRRTDWQQARVEEAMDRREADLSRREALLDEVVAAARALDGAVGLVDRAFWKHLGPEHFDDDSREARAWWACHEAQDQWRAVQGRLNDR